MIGQTQNNQNGNGNSNGKVNGNIKAGCTKQHPAKISDEFADRLASLPSDQQVRAVVLAAPYLVNGSNGARVRGEERQAIVRETRTRTEETFAEIDAVLAQEGGHRLTKSGNSLGFIVVETTPSGIATIADLDWVGTVVEDQAIRPVHQTEPPPSR
jgi:hypothetical protein